MPTYEPVTDPDELERLGQPRGAKRETYEAVTDPTELAELNRPRTLGETAKDVGKQVAAGLPRGTAELGLACRAQEPWLPRLSHPDLALPRSPERAWKRPSGRCRRPVQPRGRDNGGALRGRDCGSRTRLRPARYWLWRPARAWRGDGRPGPSEPVPPHRTDAWRCYGRGGGGRSCRGPRRRPHNPSTREHGGGVGGALGAPRAAATAADLWFNTAGSVGPGGRGVPLGVPSGSGSNPFIRSQRAPGISRRAYGATDTRAWRLRRGAARFGRLRHDASRHGAGRRAARAHTGSNASLPRGAYCPCQQRGVGRAINHGYRPGFSILGRVHQPHIAGGCQHHSPRDYGPTNRAANRAARPRHGRSHAPRGSAHRGHSRRSAISAPQ